MTTNYHVYWTSSSNRRIESHQWWRSTTRTINDGRVQVFTDLGKAEAFQKKLAKLVAEGGDYMTRTVIHVSDVQTTETP